MRCDWIVSSAQKIDKPYRNPKSSLIKDVNGDDTADKYYSAKDNQTIIPPVKFKWINPSAFSLTKAA
jgi:hypothetical protein